MVRNYAGTGRGRPDQEKLKKAVQSVLAGRLTFGKAAEEFSLKKSTIFDVVKRVKNRISEMEKDGVKTVRATEEALFEVIGVPLRTVFTQEQERELSKYLQKCSLMNHGLTPKAVRKLAYDWAQMLSLKVPETWAKEEMAGLDWFKSLMRQNSELSTRSPENTSQARAAGFNAPVVKQFFENLKSLYVRYQCGPTRIWNCDETGLPTVVQAPRVVAKKGTKQVQQTVSAERGENVTMLCFVSASGQTIPPVYVFPRVKTPDKMFQDGPPGCVGLGHRSG